MHEAVYEYFNFGLHLEAVEAVMRPQGGQYCKGLLHTFMLIKESHIKGK